MAIDFKTDRIRKEFLELQSRNPHLFSLLDELNIWVSNNLRKDIVITHLYRTKAEHDALYAQTPPEKRPKLSPHTLWQAADIRSKGFTDQEIGAIVKFITNRFKNPSGKPTAFAHAIAGGAFHVHIQYRF